MEPGLSQFVFGLEVIGHARQTKFLDVFACGIAGIGIPAFNSVEMGLKLIAPFSREIRLPAIGKSPFISSVRLNVE
jgi:hypothetical protein